MGLVKCAECGKSVSTRADVCPSCGYSSNGYYGRCMNYDYDTCTCEYDENKRSTAPGCPAYEPLNDD